MISRIPTVAQSINHGEKAHVLRAINSVETTGPTHLIQPSPQVALCAQNRLLELEVELRRTINGYRGKFTATLGKTFAELGEDMMFIPTSALPHVANGSEAIALPRVFGQQLLHQTLTAEQEEALHMIRLASQLEKLHRHLQYETTQADDNLRDLQERIHRVTENITRLMAQLKSERAEKIDTGRTKRIWEDDQEKVAELEKKSAAYNDVKKNLLADLAALRGALVAQDVPTIEKLLTELLNKYSISSTDILPEQLAVGVYFKERLAPEKKSSPAEMQRSKMEAAFRIQRLVINTGFLAAIAFAIYSINRSSDYTDSSPNQKNGSVGFQDSMDSGKARTLEDAIGYTPSSTIQYHPVAAFTLKSTAELEASQPPNISPDTAESNRRSFQAVYQLAHVREQLHKAVIYEGNTEDVRDLLRFVDEKGAITFTTRVREKEVVTITGSRGRGLDTDPEHFTVNYNTDVDVAKLDFDTCTIQFPIFQTQEWMRISFLSAVHQMRSEIQPHMPHEKNHMFFLRELQNMDPVSYTQLTLDGPKILQEIFDGQLPAWAIHEFVLKLYDLKKYEGHADEQAGVSMGTGAIMYEYAAAHGKTVDEVEEKFHQIVSLGRLYKQENEQKRMN